MPRQVEIRASADEVHMYAEIASSTYDQQAICLPPPQVWGVLLDFASYRHWNPFHRDVRIVEKDNGRRRAVSGVDVRACVNWLCRPRSLGDKGVQNCDWVLC